MLDVCQEGLQDRMDQVHSKQYWQKVSPHIIQLFVYGVMLKWLTRTTNLIGFWIISSCAAFRCLGARGQDEVDLAAGDLDEMETQNVSNPVKEKRSEQRNAHWLSFQRSEPSAKVDVVSVELPLSDSQLQEASSVRPQVPIANASQKAKKTYQQRTAQWFTGMLHSDTDHQVSTRTRQHNMHICCYVSDILPLSCVVSGR